MFSSPNFWGIGRWRTRTGHQNHRPGNAAIDGVMKVGQSVDAVLRVASRHTRTPSPTTLSSCESGLGELREGDEGPDSPSVADQSAKPALSGTGVVVLAVRRVVSQWYHAGMGMTLRTSEKQTEALRRQAVAEGRSMQAVALSAIDEYIERRAHQTEVNAVLDKVIERERGVLRRLADT